MYSRHDLVWLRPEAWDAALATVPAPLLAPLEQWRHSDWPAIVRRPDRGTLPDMVAIGIALPPVPETGVKPRIALYAPRGGIAGHAPPLALREAASAAPERWRDALLALSGLAPACGLRTYGSLALQALTSLPYLTPASDVDLLLAPANRQQLDDGIELLSAHASGLPLDGEVVFPGGLAVAWKEWRDAAGTGAKVLVKSMAAVRLAEPAALLATLEAS
jgi:phosphoribosyl-dephospho-CoA transferase